MNEFLEQFLLEAREQVQEATTDLLALEADPADGDRLDSAFRAIHTLKGGAGIVDAIRRAGECGASASLRPGRARFGRQNRNSETFYA